MKAEWMLGGPASGGARLFRVLSAIGAATALTGFFLAPERLWPALLLVSFGLLGVGLAGALFIALEYVTGASWSVALRRIPESMTAALWPGAAGMALVLLGRPELYAWYNEPVHGLPGALPFKQLWLSYPFFLARSAVYLGAWLALASAMVRTSREQDRTDNPACTVRNRKLAAIFIVVFGVTLWLASYDWIMSLEPTWYSTIFPVHHFAGMFTSGMAVMAILLVSLRRAEPLRSAVQEHHLVDLGRLMAAFATFWAYIWFSQYMLVWYANLPEETEYFIRRLEPGWAWLFLLTMALSWALPFLLLLTRAAKRNPRSLAGVAILLLLGRLLDLYVMIYPPLVGGAPVFGLWEGGILAGGIGLFVLVFQRHFRQAHPLPACDPFLQQSLQPHS
jgi:hypothetical protein